MSYQHVWTALLAIIPLAVGIFLPGLTDAVHNLLIAVGTFLSVVFGGHAIGQAHASLKGKSTV